MAVTQNRALAQDGAIGAVAKPPTPDKISKGCAADHAKFCPSNQGGTRSDVACLQQHHTNLALSCRNLLRQVPKSAGGAPQ